jgi:hypothetical protein
MRTRRLFGLTLVVLALHVLACWLAASGVPHLAVPAAGLRRVAIVRLSGGVAPAATLAMPNPLAPASRSAPPRVRLRTGPDAHLHPSPRTGEGGAAPSGAATAAAWPVYATRVPPSTSVRYRLVEGAPAAGAARDDGHAELEWRREAGLYALRLATAPPGRPQREWNGNGAFDAAGVAPERLAQRERGRDTRAINFDRDSGRVRFSGASGAPPFAPGAQDRWSWVAQLAAIAEAGAAGGHAVAADTRWDLQVAGLRGELDRWTFRVLADARPPPELQAQGNDVSSGPDRAPALLHVLRAPEHPYDLRIEAWLSPSLHHLPAGLRMSTPPGPWSLSFWQLPPAGSTGPVGS